MIWMEGTWREIVNPPRTRSKAWAMDSHGKLKIKLQYKEMNYFEEDVVTIHFSKDYNTEMASLRELRKIKPDKRYEAQKSEIVRLQSSTKAERTRQGILQTQEAVKAFYRGMEVDCTCFIVDFHRNTFKISFYIGCK